MFIAKLAENAEIELEFTTLSGYCPGADEKGNNPNGLRSINENTRIGDMCSSTNINYGEVIFRKGYNCTCFAMGCNDGYSFDRDAQGNLKEGRCITVTSDQPQNNKQTETKDKCTAVEVPFSIGTSISEIMSALQRAKNTCNAALKKLGCTGEVDFKSFLPDSKDKNRKVIVCNPSATQIADFKKLVEKKKADKKKAAQDLKYYEVCGKDKGKSGKKEYCIEDFFNWTRTQTSQGIGFAQKYAQSKNHHEIFCDTKYRTELNDDY